MNFIAEKLHLIRVDLKSFWKDMGGKEHYGKDISPEVKLSALIEMSKKFYFKRTTTRAKLRRKFNKFYKSTFQFPCFICRGESQIRHHIILLKNGGHNGKLNRIALCKPCHSEIHPWLRVQGGQKPISARSITNTAHALYQPAVSN